MLFLLVNDSFMTNIKSLLLNPRKSSLLLNCKRLKIGSMKMVRMRLKVFTLLSLKSSRRCVIVWWMLLWFLIIFIFLKALFN